MQKKLFDPSISIGNILTFIGMVFAIVVSWNSLNRDVAVMQYQIQDVRSQVADIKSQLNNRTADNAAKYRQVNYYKGTE